ncbi:MAG: AlkA N-terminal domain-containing protein [Deltaproteobacteria bacterium]|nr:AlkA N-terminal domain-containing protein [Myxococcales bacterium]MDP3215069.1 AlkA N-terminal domain-containing protein [Deltaproteobacteria bacterium]
MTTDGDARYSAYVSRDARFDGVFFIGVTSTGIYCRPVCTAKTPRVANCRFFDSAEAAEKAAFRPCLRCRPELAPGSAPVDDARRVAGLVVRRIEEAMLDGDPGLDAIAAQFELSARQLRRIVHDELGVSPMELVSTRRLLLAKQLLTETRLPITEVAFASGFASLRRFNDAFRTRYGMAPGRLRRDVADASTAAAESLTLQLTYRPPYDWDGVLAFLGARALRGVERVDEGAYARTVRLGAHRGHVRVRHAPARRALLVEVSLSLTPALPALLGRLRGVFDLGARPDVVAAHLGADPRLAAAVARHPGLRVPGAFEGFELAVRAVLGQQVSVKAATTLAGRFAEAFGEALDGAPAGLTRLAPTADRVAAAREEEITALGVVASRARSIVAIAREVASGRLRLEPGAAPEETLAALVALPGVGPWTAQYIALRALGRPDAFPRDDLVLRRALGAVTAAQAEAASQAWRPWRSYATLHLWREAGGG